MEPNLTRSLTLSLVLNNKDLDVAALNFDTLEYVKQLTDAGVERQVAEIHAITVGRAMGMYVDNLVTKEYLDATLDARFAAQDAKFEKRFAKQDLKLEQKFAEQDAKFEQRFNKSESDMRVLKWGQALVIGAVLLPQVAKLVG